MTEVGAALRTCQVAGRLLVEPFPAAAMADGAHGMTLLPWPNRIRGGHYSFGGTEHQLPLTEPEAGNAIHGLLMWRPWSVRERGDSAITLSATLHPQPGYPFALEATVEYSIGPGGLSVTTTAENVGNETCPYGCGHHPYLYPGEGTQVDDCVLSLPASLHALADQSLLPFGKEEVSGTDMDFRQGRSIGGLRLDDGFSNLQRDPKGLAWASLSCPDGASIEMWVDRSYLHLQVFTGDTLTPERRRRGLACEPMTCPPNAFQSGEDLLALEPGERATASWGLRLS